jgi:hypothetical protein
MGEEKTNREEEEEEEEEEEIALVRKEGEINGHCLLEGLINILSYRNE